MQPRPEAGTGTGPGRNYEFTLRRLRKRGEAEGRRVSHPRRARASRRKVSATPRTVSIIECCLRNTVDRQMRTEMVMMATRTRGCGDRDRALLAAIATEAETKA